MNGELRYNGTVVLHVSLQNIAYVRVSDVRYLQGLWYSDAFSVVLFMEWMTFNRVHLETGYEAMLKGAKG